MKTTTTKFSVLAFLGLGLVAYGQSGKVGINVSSPQATLDIQPTTTNSQADAKTNEGILAPRLSKSRVAGIETPVEGTLVYVIDDTNKTNGTIDAYTGSDPKVAKITEKGYYYYDGTEWVKSTAGSLDQEWVYNPTEKNIELKRSGVAPFENKVYYTPNGGYVSSSLQTFPVRAWQTGVIEQTPISKLSARVLNTYKSSEVPTLVDEESVEFKKGEANYMLIDASNPVARNYMINNSLTIAPDVTQTIERAYAQSTGVYKLNNAPSAVLIGSIGSASINGSGSVTNYMTGSYAAASMTYGTNNISHIATTQSRTLFGKGANQSVSTAFSNDSDIYLGANAAPTITEAGVYNANFAVVPGAGGSITDFYGYRMADVSDLAAERATNIYGLHIGNIGTTANQDKKFAIYTKNGKVRFGDRVGVGVDAPTEMLEVAGKVKASSFIGTNGASFFPDYVFQKYYTGISNIKADYSFKTLSQVEDFVKTNGHLPGYQSAEAIKKQGYIDLMATQLTNVEKIEELYLHSIEQDKALKAKDAKIAELENRLKAIEQMIMVDKK